MKCWWILSIKKQFLKVATVLITGYSCGMKVPNGQRNALQHWKVATNVVQIQSPSSFKDNKMGHKDHAVVNLTITTVRFITCWIVTGKWPLRKWSIAVKISFPTRYSDHYTVYWCVCESHTKQMVSENNIGKNVDRVLSLLLVC